MKKFKELSINTRTTIVTLGIIAFFSLWFGSVAINPLLPLFLLMFFMIIISVVLLWCVVKRHLLLNEKMNEKYGKHSD